MVDESSWSKLIERVRAVSLSVSSLLVSSKPLEFDGERIKLGVCYKFHKDMLEESRNRQILENTATDIFNKNVRFECLLIDPPSDSASNPVLTEVGNDNILKSAEELFS